MNNVIFIPGSPALIPELSPHDAASRRLLNAAVEMVSTALAGRNRQVEIVFSQDKRWFTAHEGSFLAWGAPQVDVGKGHYLGELVARYVLSHAGLDADDVVGCRGEIDEFNSDICTVVVLDGSAGLTSRAPLALIDTAEVIHQWCQQALLGKAPRMDVDTLIQAGVIEPGLWLELAQLSPVDAQLVDVDLSLGVGRYIAAWEV